MFADSASNLAGDGSGFKFECDTHLLFIHELLVCGERTGKTVGDARFKPATSITPHAHGQDELLGSVADILLDHPTHARARQQFFNVPDHPTRARARQQFFNVSDHPTHARANEVIVLPVFTCEVAIDYSIAVTTKCGLPTETKPYSLAP